MAGFEVTILFAIAAVCIIAVVGLGTLAYLHHRSQPTLERRARVVAKRQHVSGDFGMISVTTSYFVTFEFEGEEREEREVKGEEYGQLIEGDTVMVTTKGDSLLGYRRSEKMAQTMRSA